LGYAILKIGTFILSEYPQVKFGFRCCPLTNVWVFFNLKPVLSACRLTQHRRQKDTKTALRFQGTMKQGKLSACMVEQGL
jgi:hypothetical protein